MTNLRLIKQILYRLKREYGVTVTLRKNIAPTTEYDPETGTSTLSYTDYLVKRTISGPLSILRDPIYDLSYIAAGKNFTEGAFFDAGDRAFIFDHTELRKAGLADQRILRQDSIYHNSLRYEISKVHAVEGNWGWIIEAKEIANPGAKA